MTSASTIMWKRLDRAGHEVAELAAVEGGWRLTGVVIVEDDGRPCRLEYAIECDAEWRTRRARVFGQLGGAPVSLDLAHGPRRGWQVNGVSIAELRHCVDVDLEFSPSTNLLPIRRLRLAVGAHGLARAAWVRFPSLVVEPLEQTYTRLAVDRYRYETTDGEFEREITVNDEGLVLEYPGQWRTEAASRGTDLIDDRNDAQVR
jgi:uncharacterized protein